MDSKNCLLCGGLDEKHSHVCPLGTGGSPRRFAIGGVFDGILVNPDGSIAARCHGKNGVCNVGLNDLLNVYFGAGTQKTLWYLGLIDNASFASLAIGDSMSSHAGWIEMVAYSESVRQTWGLGAAASQTITNAVAASFSINATKTINGAFLTSVSTKSGTTGILWATGSFASTQLMVSGQVFKAFYTLTAQPV